MKLQNSVLLVLFLSLFFVNIVQAVETPTDGDYRTRNSGNWDAAVWQIRTGGNWSNTSVLPSSSNNIFIQSGHTITINIATVSCNNLNIHTSGVLTIGQRIIEVNGKIRAFTGTNVTTTGADGTFYSGQTSSTSPVNAMLTTTLGVLKFVGNSRNLTFSGEWGATTQGHATEFAITTGETGTFATGYKSSSILISSGIIDMGSNRLAPDNGTSGQGDVTISAGATLISANSGASSPVMSRTGTASSGYAGTFTLNGTLILTGSAPQIEFKTITIGSTGTIIYIANGNQSLLKSTFTSAASIPTYNNLILSGTNAKSLSYNTTINGKLTLEGTASLDLSTYLLTYGSSSILEYKGSSTQTTTNIEFPLSGGPKNLTINNSNGVILHENRSINGTLTLLSGKLYTGSNTITLGTSTSSLGTLLPITPTSSSYIIGNFKRWIGTTANVDYTFPVGSVSYFRPVTLKYTENPSGGTLTLTYNETNPGNNGSLSSITDNGYTINTYSSELYYQIIPGDGLVSDSHLYNLEMNTAYLSHVNDDANKRGNLRILKRASSTSNWSVVGDHSAATGSGPTLTIKRIGLSGFSEFGIGSNADDNPLQGGLPVTLSSFTYSNIGNNIKLNWTTQSEINNAGFEIERKEVSSQNSVFRKFGFINGNGTKNTPTNYTYEDKNLQSGKYKYRLKQIDINGNFEYHNLNSIIEITPPKKLHLNQNYPNPFNPKTVISFEIPSLSGESSKNISLKIYDAIGREVSTLFNGIKEPGYHSIEFDASSLSSGTYFYRLSSSDFSIVKKFVLLK